jgi:hypothetical protein
VTVAVSGDRSEARRSSTGEEVARISAGQAGGVTIGGSGSTPNVRVSRRSLPAGSRAVSVIEARARSSGTG